MIFNRFLIFSILTVQLVNGISLHESFLPKEHGVDLAENEAGDLEQLGTSTMPTTTETPDEIDVKVEGIFDKMKEMLGVSKEESEEEDDCDDEMESFYANTNEMSLAEVLAQNDVEALAYNGVEYTPYEDYDEDYLEEDESEQVSADFEYREGDIFLDPDCNISGLSKLVKIDNAMVALVFLAVVQIAL